MMYLYKPKDKAKLAWKEKSRALNGIREKGIERADLGRV